LGNVLDMSLTLEQNGVPDERELYAKLNLVRAELKCPVFAFSWPLSC